jgi:P22 coat protein - gene protein 5
MAIVVDQAKLVLNAFAAIFQNNLASADLVSWKQYNGEFEDRNRLQISEQVGPRFAVTQTTNGVQDLTAGVQDMIYGSEQFTVNQVFGTSMGYGDWAKVRDIGEARESVAIKNAALNLAEKIDAYVLRTAVLASNNWTGTPGNNVSTYDNVAAAYTRLKDEGVDDSELRAILSYSDKQALGNFVVQSAQSYLPDMDTKVFKNGFESTVAGIDTMFTQQLPTLTSGTRVASGANIKMNAANQHVNYSAVSVSAAPGQYLSQTINVTVGTATETVNDGETFTVAGLNAWDNRLGASLGRPQQFRVIGSYTAAAGVIAAMRIFPAMIVPGVVATGGVASDANVNTANATVDSIPGAAALITFNTAASSQVRARAIIQKEAIVVNTVDLITPATGQASRKSLTKIPLSIRMWRDSAFATGDHRVRFDVALTANVRDRRRIVRLNG